jgi:hypothetical protein
MLILDRKMLHSFSVIKGTQAPVFINRKLNRLTSTINEVEYCIFTAHKKSIYAKNGGWLIRKKVGNKNGPSLMEPPIRTIYVHSTYVS